MKNFIKAAFSTIFLASLSFANVTISSPANGATVGSPVNIVASDDNAVAIHVYVDDNDVYQVGSNSLDASIDMSTGSHYVVVQSWDAYGNVSKASLNLNVGSASQASSTQTSSSGINVSSPANGATVGSPVHFAGSSSTATGFRIYIDNNDSYYVHASSFDTYLPVSSGSHNVVVQAWDQYGNVSKAPLSINVSGSSSQTSTTPTTQTSSSGINVSSPANGSTVGSPVHFAASASNATAFHIYIDDNNAYSVNASSFDTYLSVSGGTHSVVIQSWDRYGNVSKAPLSITVSGSSGGSTSTSSSSSTSSGSSYSNINQMSGWDSCNVCAGAGGNGPADPYSSTQWRSDPSIDGTSMEFWLGGSTPWGGALWWKQLTPQSAASHLTYDLYFYYQNANAPQALEFDVNQVANGTKYIFGTQCDIKGAAQWEVWDTANGRWVQTGIACSAPPTYTWNHLTEEFVRNSDGSMTFVSITLNGNKHYVNRTYWGYSQSGSELNVAFQMDGNGSETNYSVWLDKISLYYY